MISNVAYFLSLFCIIAAVSFTLYAIIVISDNRSSIAYWVFAVACLSIAMWAFGFAISYSAFTQASALFWRRFSTIGLCSFYSLLVHYLLLRIKNLSFVKKPLFCILFYAHSIILTLLFATPLFGIGYQPNIISTPWGWSSHYTFSTHYIFFYIYYIICSLIVLFLLNMGSRHSHNQKQKRQYRIFLIYIGIAILLGSLTDVILQAVLNDFLQVSPIIIMFPLSYALFKIGRQGTFKHSPREDATKIITDEFGIVFHDQLHIPFLIGAAIAFIREWLIYDTQKWYAAALTLTIAGVGLMVRAILKSIQSESVKDNQVTFFISLLVPILTFHGMALNQSSLWALPLVYMTFFILYNSRKMMLALSSSILISYIATIFILPEQTLNLTISDHFFRLFIYILFLGSTLVVTRYNLKRLRQFNNQLASNQLIAAVSTMVVQAGHDDFDMTINNVLDNIGNFFEADRSHFFVTRNDSTILYHSNEWYRKAVNQSKPDQNYPDLSEAQWLYKQLITKKFISITTTDDLPEEAGLEHHILNKHGIRSCYAVGLFEQSALIGVIQLDFMSTESNWNGTKRRTLLILGNILSDALSRHFSESKITELAFYDQLTGLANRELFRMSINKALANTDRDNGICLVMLDLDGFKNVNDTLGHDMGDSLLIQVARRMQHHLKTTESISRFGGDEFMLLYTDIGNVKRLPSLGQEIKNAFERPFVLGEQSFDISASIGLTYTTVNEKNFITLVKEADMAMYQAKTSGKNTYIIYDF